MRTGSRIAADMITIRIITDSHENRQQDSNAGRYKSRYKVSSRQTLNRPQDSARQTYKQATG